jgi:formate hydrogenlyase subunit 4
MTADLRATLVPVVQLVALVLAAPAFTGLLAWLEDRFSARAGRSLLSPYWRLAKLAVKDEVRPAGSSLVYDLAPAFAFAATVAAAGLVPVVTTRAPLGAAGGVAAFCGLLALARFATALAALDAGNPLAALAVGHERRAGSLAEPALLLSLLALALASGTAELGGIVALPGSAAVPGRLLALGGLVLAVLADSHRPAGEAASRFGPGATRCETGGIRLAIVGLTLDLRRLALFVLAVNLVLPWGIAGSGEGEGRELAVALGLLALKLAVAALLAVLVAAGLGKANRLGSSEILGAALVLAILGLFFVALGAPGGA